MSAKQISELENKIKTLRLKLGKIGQIIAKRDQQALECKQGSTSSIMSAVEALKSVIEEKFAEGESEDEIATCSEETEQHLESADDTSRKIQHTINEMDVEEVEHEAAEAHKRSMEF